MRLKGVALERQSAELSEARLEAEELKKDNEALVKVLDDNPLLD